MFTVKQEKLKCTGYIYENSMSPKNGFQFADDTSIVTALEEDNQLLLNLFAKWCVWADFIIRIDKCHSFAIKKTKTASSQYLPYLTIMNERIPPVPLNESFTYLGKSFNFSMDNTIAKENILSTIEKHVSKVDILPLHPRQKITIITRYSYSKTKWDISCYDIDTTWLKQKCDNLILQFIRKWLNMHPGANTSHLKLPVKKLGLNLFLPSDIYIQSKTSTRSIMRNSNDQDIRSLYVETHDKHINADKIIETVHSTANRDNQLSKTKCNRELRKQSENNTWAKFIELHKQNLIVKYIIDTCLSSTITSWNRMAEYLPKNIYSFLRRALILALPTMKNLATWNLINDDTCPLCNQKPQTQHHILNNCSAAANQHRYLWRHNSVLNTMVYYLSSTINATNKIYVDIPGFLNTDSLFMSGHRPDLVFETKDEYFVIELTICFETNLYKSRQRKRDRYANLKNDIRNKNKKMQLILVEFTSLGFYSPEMKDLKNILKSLGLDHNRLLSKCQETSIRCSYYIFNRRSKEWTLPELLQFY